MTKHKVIGWTMAIGPIALFLGGSVLSSPNPLAALVVIVVISLGIAVVYKGIAIISNDS